MKMLARVLGSLVAMSLACLHAQTTPANVKITNTADTSVTLQWDAQAAGITYKVYYSTNAALTPQNTPAFKTVAAGTDQVDGLTPATKYYFVVTAVQGSTESAPSSPVFATTAASAAGAAPPPSGGASTAKPTGPTTNVGANPDVNTQSADVGLVALPSMPKGLSAATGTLGYDKANVESLVSTACSAKFSTFSKDVQSGSTYAIINVLNLTGDSGSQSVQSNNWYLYSQDKNIWNGFIGGWTISDFNGATRLYGADKIYLVSLLLNDRSSSGNAPPLTYKVTVTRQQATNVADVMALLSIVAPAAGLQQTTSNWIGCDALSVEKNSTIKIDTTYNEEHVTPLQASQTFTNEGKSHWDVSFALPVKKASALQYSSTSNTVTASSINKNNLFAVADIYPIPVNLTATSPSLVPDFFFGVAMDSQPLHSLIFGASVGIHLAQIYAGALLIKQQQLAGLSSGSTATPGQLAGATSYSYQPQFTVGIKISIRSAASSLSKGKQ